MTDELAGKHGWHGLRVSFEENDDATTVLIEGELDASSSDQLLGTMAQVSPTPPRLIIVDLGRLTFIDSAGLRALMTIRDSVGDGFRLGPVSRQVQRLLEVSGTAEAFQRHGSLDEEATELQPAAAGRPTGDRMTRESSGPRQRLDVLRRLSDAISRSPQGRRSRSD